MILSKDEIDAIKGMIRYWDEVQGRDDAQKSTQILWSELSMITKRLGLRLLWILKDYVETDEK